MKSKKLYMTLLVLSIVFLGIGGTFAALTRRITAVNITQIRSGNLTMTVDGGGSENVNLYPTTCTGDNVIKKTIKASAVSTPGGKLSFSIGLDITTLSDGLKKNTMRYALTTSPDSCTTDVVASGNFSGATSGTDFWLVKKDFDITTQSGDNYSKTYYLYIWLDELEMGDASGNIAVKVIGSSSNNPDLKTEKTVLLYDYIKGKADTTTIIDFSKTSEASSTNGIYSTTDTDSEESVYYYRGKVDNNVIFANFCWKIIRTTETMGVKLLYNGVLSNGQCNNTTSSAITVGNPSFNSGGSSTAKYVGYMYGNSADDVSNTNDSTIKEFVDTWYKNNIIDYTSQLEDTIFCNDRSYIGNVFGSYARLVTNKQPTLKCQDLRDKFTVDVSNGNGDLTYPVGLITADEIAYAGGVYGYGNSNSSYYLYSGKSVSQWTMSPFSIGTNNTRQFYISSSNTLEALLVGSSNNARPVVSLKSDIEFISGDGTATSPFVIE